MNFSGFQFLLGFLPLFLSGVALAGRLGPDWTKSWLIVASLAFYAVGATDHLPVLVLSIAGNFALLQAMHRRMRPHRLVGVGVTLNLALLAWFKYYDPESGIPLGLSFFTFTQIGCLLYHGDGETPPPRALDYALFAGFFPTLLAGPVLSARDMLPQFARNTGWHLTAGNLSVGSAFFLIGLLKKTLLADPLASVVAAGFADPAHLTLFPAWQAAMSFSLQLYFDFSGYTDMAIGLGLMVGLRLPDNFNQPYRATSVIDYWQRWHMSLTRFVMAHVHGPLTLAVLRWRRDHGHPIDARAQLSASGFLGMIAMPVVATILLVALWHGATLPFLLFGLLHAAFLLVNRAWRLARAPVLGSFVGAVLTYCCVLVGAVVFAASSASDAASMLAGMAGQHGIVVMQPGIEAIAGVLRLAALYGIVWFAPTTRQWLQAGVPARFAWKPSAPWAVAMGGAATLGLLAAGGTGEFLYIRF